MPPSAPADFRSDTVTRPTPAMSEAMFQAELGDDVLGDDPTVRRLEEAAAARLGKEAALFMPSGTMANQVALRLHTQPGDAAVLESRAHVFGAEAGAAAWLSGVTVAPVPGERGILDPGRVAACFRPEDPHLAPVTLVCAEDTSNAGGGTVYPLEVLDALAELAHQRGAGAHLDGARLFNAEVASGVPAARRARGYDTVSICLSKGLGAPVGSVLVLPASHLLRARRVRKAFGGGLRQAGLLAAAGLHALDHHVERLAEDHDRAAALAEGLQGQGWEVRYSGTNMVYVACPDPSAKVADLEERGVRCLPAGPGELRLVTHLDVDDEDVTRAVEAFGSPAVR